MTTATSLTPRISSSPASSSYRNRSSNLSLTLFRHPLFSSVSLSSNLPTRPTHIVAGGASSTERRQQQNRKRPQQQQPRNQKRGSSSQSPQQKKSADESSRGFGGSRQRGRGNGNSINSSSKNNSRKVVELEAKSVAVVEEMAEEEVVEETWVEDEEEDEWLMEEEEEEEGRGKRSPPQMPKPPAGFVFDEDGRVVLASKKRIITIVDEASNQPLDCIIRRVFQSSKGDECMLLCPADMPVQILKSQNFSGWTEIDDDEVEAIFPHASYALAKNHMHLVDSGFCYTARGGYCYADDQILDFLPDEEQGAEGSHNEGVEIASFSVDGIHYIIYTPIEPLLFVAVKDEKGQYRMADDDLLDDPIVGTAIDEETEFTAFVEEEEALRDAILGDER